MGVKMPIEILSINTYRLMYGILQALDDHFVYNDSVKQDKQDEQTRDKIMSLIHDYIGKPQVKNDISNCAELCFGSDIDQMPTDEDGWFDMKYVEDLMLFDFYGPQRAMRDVLWAHVPKPIRMNKAYKYIIEDLMQEIGKPFEEFECAAIKLRREYVSIVDPSIMNNYGDTWITKLVSLYENLWKEIYNDE